MTADTPGEPPAPRSVAATLATDVQDEEIASVRDVSFPVVMRGYDRAAVDAYVTRVNRIIAELQVSRSPRSAIRHALDQVSEETRGILERAHETADGIAARSRSQAHDRLQRAESEARAAIESAEARVRELDTDADAVRRERNRLLDDVRHVSDRLSELVQKAAARFPPEPGEPDARTVAIDPGELEPDDGEDARGGSEPHA
jgi:DivIVA domain-containing protein